MRKTENLTRMMHAHWVVGGAAKKSAGWSYGRGERTLPRARENADLIASLFTSMGIDEIAAFPDLDGGLMVTGYRGIESFEILCTPEGKFDVLFEADNAEESVAEFADFDALLKMMGEKGWQLRNTSASFLQNTTTYESAAISGSPLKIRQAEEYPSLTFNAPLSDRVVYVSTFSNFTHEHSTARQLRSGASQPMNCLLEAI